METHQSAAPQTHQIGAVPLSPHPEVVTIMNAALIACVSRRTIYNWIEKGLIEVWYRPSGSQLVVVESLLKRSRPVGTRSGLAGRIALANALATRRPATGTNASI